jgi:hypothetical protein
VSPLRPFAFAAALSTIAACTSVEIAPGPDAGEHDAAIPDAEPDAPAIFTCDPDAGAEVPVDAGACALDKLAGQFDPGIVGSHCDDIQIVAASFSDSLLATLCAIAPETSCETLPGGEKRCYMGGVTYGVPITPEVAAKICALSLVPEVTGIVCAVYL